MSLSLFVVVENTPRSNFYDSMEVDLVLLEKKYDAGFAFSFITFFQA